VRCPGVFADGHPDEDPLTCPIFGRFGHFCPQNGLIPSRHHSGVRRQPFAVWQKPFVLSRQPFAVWQKPFVLSRQPFVA
jgi:hypothetical protein